MSKIGQPLKVCYVQSYRAPDYIRGTSLCAALERDESIGLTRAVNATCGWRRYWETLRALVRIRFKEQPDIYVLGFRGHEIAWLVRLIAHGKPLVFDAMMSPHGALVEEGKHGVPGRLMGPLVRVLERHALHMADLVLTDTRMHQAFFTDAFGVPAARLLPVPIGARELPSSPQMPRSPGAPMKVLFYGSLLPLHGLDYLLEAAGRLAGQPIHFDFIGGTDSQGRQLRARCEAMGIDYRWRRWVPLRHLLEVEIPNADLCLGGPFGGTPQALRVVTGKASQCLALGRATLIGMIDEDQGFIDRHNCLLVPQADAGALAGALLWALDHPQRLAAIGREGQALYTERLSIEVIRARLVPALHDLRGRPTQGSGA